MPFAAPRRTQCKPQEFSRDVAMQTITLSVRLRSHMRVRWSVNNTQASSPHGRGRWKNALRRTPAAAQPQHKPPQSEGGPRLSAGVRCCTPNSLLNEDESKLYSLFSLRRSSAPFAVRLHAFAPLGGGNADGEGGRAAKGGAAVALGITQHFYI